MQARESGKAVLEPASARWPIFGVWRTRKSCCTKDHEFLARRSPKKGCCTKNHEFLARQSPKKCCCTKDHEDRLRWGSDQDLCKSATASGELTICGDKLTIFPEGKWTIFRW